MIQPQSKFSDIFSDIERHLKLRVSFDDFEAMKLSREIRKLESICDQNMLLGMLYTAQGKADDAFKHFENALASTHADDVIMFNYVASLREFNRYELAMSKGAEFVESCKSPMLIEQLSFLQLLALDLPAYAQSSMELEKMNKLENLMDERSQATLMEEFINKGCFTAQELASVGSSVLRAAELSDVVVYGNQVCHSHEGKHLSVKYALDAEMCTSSKLCDLNLLLIEQLIEEGLDELPIVAQFIRLNKPALMDSAN